MNAYKNAYNMYTGHTHGNYTNALKCHSLLSRLDSIVIINAYETKTGVTLVISRLKKSNTIQSACATLQCTCGVASRDGEHPKNTQVTSQHWNVANEIFTLRSFFKKSRLSTRTCLFYLILPNLYPDWSGGKKKQLTNKTKTCFSSFGAFLKSLLLTTLEAPLWTTICGLHIAFPVGL